LAWAQSTAVVSGEVRVSVETDMDIVVARQQGRQLAERYGFRGVDLIVIATAISEIARNILSYATRGEVLLRGEHQGGRQGIVVVARDDGPGVEDIERAMEDGFSTGDGLGLGLPGARRLMDEFEIISAPGAGTTVTMRKWVAT
jgi:serine/threonine-protein kinase RsbT